MGLFHQIGKSIQTTGVTMLRLLQGVKPPSKEGPKDCHCPEAGLRLPAEQTRLRREVNSTVPRFRSPGLKAILGSGSTEPNGLTIRRRRKRIKPQPVQLRWVFTVISGVDHDRQYLGITREIRIGRQPENHIQLRDPKVSRFHAVIHCRGAVLILEDHHSTNGTWINGCRVSRKRLFSGDLIRVGETEIRVIQQQ